MTPQARYEAALAAGTLLPNAQQAAVVTYLQSCYETLVNQQVQLERASTSWRRLLHRPPPQRPITGIYLWGEVGTGKTVLLDSFYDCLPVPKIRQHTHQFMQWLDQTLKQYQGQKNPLARIAKELASRTTVIYLDEFFVSHVADAMLMATFLAELFKHRICLITTSNTAPDQLYLNGLQRQRFLPAIGLLHQYTRVMHLSIHTDYRKQRTCFDMHYYTPLNPKSDQRMQTMFESYRHNHPTSTDAIQLYGRPISIIKQANGVIWFDFKQICGRPRSRQDYLALAQQYHTIMVSHVQRIKPDAHHFILSLIYLVDILYDHHCTLVMQASVPANQLYPNGPYVFEFKRTLSRLQSHQNTTNEC